MLEHMQGISAQIPNSITFFQMYQVERPSQLRIEERWRKNNSSKSLAVPLGARAAGDYVYLNLHEKAHNRMVWLQVQQVPENQKSYNRIFFHLL